MANNKRWLYLAVGTLLLIFCGLIYGWSLFKTPFSEVYTEWSLSQLSMTFTISMIFFCIGGFTAGKLAAKFKPQMIILLSAVCLLAGFFGVSRLDPGNPSSSLPMLYICYGVLGGTGVGLTYNCVIGTMNKWFPDKPGLCSGIMMMGFGLGALILGSIATGLIASKGIFTTFMILGIMIFVVLAVGSFFIKVPDAPAGKGGPQKELYGEGPGVMLKTASFWIFIVWCVVIGVGGLMVINSAASIAVAFGAPAIVGMIVSVFNGAGRVIVGGIYDKTNGKVAMIVDVVFMFAGGIALLAGAKAGSMVLVLIGLLAMGLSYGANPTICSTLIQKYYGPKFFAVNFGIGMFNLVPAAIIGPTISSSLVEKSGGAYDSSFVAILVFAVLALVLWILVCKIIDKENSKREQPRPY
ncbi:MFS transporter [Ihubacter sp. mB4P-1]|uniref:MFS transporter n=1 Tax=Ihubacter sp. mB4P-1 TaxID=3242370 RepID=UPI00137AF363